MWIRTGDHLLNAARVDCFEVCEVGKGEAAPFGGFTVQALRDDKTAWCLAAMSRNEAVAVLCRITRALSEGDALVDLQR